MYVELQLSASVFERIVQNRLKAVRPCSTYMEFDVPNIGTLAVDKVEIISPTSLQRAPAATLAETPTIVTPTGSIAQLSTPFLQVVFTLAVSVVKKSDLIANGVNPTPPVVDGVISLFNLPLIYNVAAFVAGGLGAGGPVQLSYTFNDVDFGTDASLIPMAAQAQIKSSLASFTLPAVTMDFSSLFESLLGRPATAINCGITCDAPLNDSPSRFVALRVEVQPESDSVDQFTRFFNGPDDFLQNQDWSIFIDSQILVEQTANLIRTSLSGNSDFILKSGPDASWTESGIDMSLSGTAVSACKPLGWDMDVDAELTVTMSVASVNQIRTKLHLDVHPSNIVQVGVCAATNALLWPILGLAMLGEGEVNIAEYLIGLAVHPLLRLVALVFAIETAGISEDLSSDLGSNWHQVDDDDYESDDPLDASTRKLPGLETTLEFDSSSPLADGLVMGGSVTDLNETPNGSLVGVTATPFTWQVGGNCQGGFTIINQATIFVDVEDGANLCSAQILNNPTGISTRVQTTGYSLTRTDNKLTIAPESLTLGASGTPKLPTTPCQILVITSDGIRIITLQPPSAIIPLQNTQLQEAATVARINCLKLTKVFTPSEKIGWLVDGPRDPGSLQFWQIFVDHLHGQTIELQNEEGHALLTSHAASAGMAQMVLILDERAATNSLTIHLGGHAVAEGTELAVSVQQILYQLRSSIEAPDSLTQLTFAGSRADLRLIVGSANLSSIWTVKSPRMPVLLQSMVTLGNGMGPALHGGVSISSELSAKAQSVLQSSWAAGLDYSTIGNPPIGGFKETLYLGSRKKGTLYSISKVHAPEKIQGFHSTPWFVGTALSGKLLARLSSTERTVNIYEAVAEYQR
jgi:hypothetical protein